MSCCNAMSAHLDRVCGRHADAWDCPDATLVTTNKGVGIPVRDGGSSYIEIAYCPWCGANLKHEANRAANAATLELAARMANGEISPTEAQAEIVKRIMEDGRKLASERDDLIAQGVDPTELIAPIAPMSSDNGPLDWFIEGSD